MTSTTHQQTRPKAEMATYRRGVLVARDLISGLSVPLVIFVGLIAVGFLAVSLGITISGLGDSARSVWENSAYATRYFPLALGIMLTGVYLPAVLAHGITRRAFGVGAALVVLGIAGVMAVLEAVGYLVENGLYRLGGAEQTFTTPHVFDSGAHFWIVIPEVWIVVAGNVAVGWLIGTAYYRWGWFWPTIALPLMCVPALVVEALMSVGWPGALLIDVLGIDRLPAGIAVSLSLGVIALTLWGTAALVRTIDIRPQKA